MSSNERKSKEENDQKDEKKLQLNGGKVHDDDDDEDDVPLSSLKTKRASVSKPTYKDLSEDDDDDDDDNIPLISLVSKGSSKPKAETTSPKKKAASKKAVTTKKAGVTKAKPKSPVATKKKVSAKASKESASPKKKKKTSVASVSTSSSSSKTYEWVSAALYGSNCDKGLLIQRLLCRWWYAVAWPDLAHPVRPIPDASQYDTLDGFPGVYIGTAPEVVGEIYDTRDLSTAPTFRNLVAKPSAELQELLIRAIEEQKLQLIATLENSEEDSGKVSTDATLKDLEGMLKWARKVNPTKADKDAVTVLKAHGLRL